MKNIHVGVCIPSSGEWVDEFGRSLALMFSYFAQKRVEGCNVQKLSLLTVSGSMLVYLRHKLVLNALQAGCTHLLFLDSDMKFPKNILNKMLEWDKDVLSLNCTTRHEPIQPTSFDLRDNRVDSRKKHGLQRISHGGMAVMLAKAEAVKLLTPPLFSMEWIPEMRAYCGEDVYFCMKLAEAGVKIYVDHDLSREIQHVGRGIYGHSDIKYMGVEDEKTT